MGTVNPWSKPQDATFFTLKPIAWDGEGKEYTPTTHSGDTIVLNRSNTDPNNNSITSKEQAVLSREDGHWYLENRSEQKTHCYVWTGRWNCIQAMLSSWGTECLSLRQSSYAYSSAM